MPDLKQEQQIAQRVTLVGAGADAALGLAKILAGYASHSQALIADGIHSLSDLVTDVFVYIAANNARQGPDKNHPYGHLRFETLTTVLLGMVLILVALGIGYDAITSDSEAQFTWYGTFALVLTILVKEGLFHYTKRAGEKISSPLLIANAWHSRTDALSSIAVLIGLIGVYFGVSWADTLASLVVALLIGKMAISMMWDNLAELVDTAPDPELIEQIKETANSLKNVAAPHDVRARSMAGKIYLDMHIHVPSHGSVSEGHYLSDLVSYTIKHAHPQVADVMIHVDTDDRIQKDSIGQEQSTSKPDHLKLPTRDQVLADFGFLLRLHNGYLDLPMTKLHYLGKQLYVELIADPEQLPSSLSIKQATYAIQTDLQSAHYISQVDVFWRIKGQI
ncbi:cation diffusion facilitator family transporter [Marinomonas epiphytica]